MRFWTATTRSAWMEILPPNDTVVVIANGLAGNEEITEPGDDYKKFCDALHIVAVDLSQKIAGDGEGCEKLLEAHVTGAPDKDGARKVAKSVICSSLFKAAVFASDANWGKNSLCHRICGL